MPWEIIESPACVPSCPVDGAHGLSRFDVPITKGLRYLIKGGNLRNEALMDFGQVYQDDLHKGFTPPAPRPQLLCVKYSYQRSLAVPAGQHMEKSGSCGIGYWCMLGVGGGDTRGPAGDLHHP